MPSDVALPMGWSRAHQQNCQIAWRCLGSALVEASKTWHNSRTAARPKTNTPRNKPPQKLAACQPTNACLHLRESCAAAPLALNQMASAAAPFLRTETSVSQHALEVKVSELYQDLAEFDAPDREEMLMLLRDKHTRYLQVHVCAVTLPLSAHTATGPRAQTHTFHCLVRPAAAVAC